MRYLCSVCGQPPELEGTQYGNIFVCGKCEPAVQIEIDKLNAKKKPGNMAHIVNRLYNKKNPGAITLQIRALPNELKKALTLYSSRKNLTVRETVLIALYYFFGEDI